MRKIKDSIAVIGEGITEYYYFNSLKDEYPQINFRPMYPKHSTSLNDLELEINKAIDMEYDLIFCVIDMDNKKEGIEKQNYQHFKRQFDGFHKDKKTGHTYTIRFIENERCTELFFLFYFLYTSRCFMSQPELLDALNKHCKHPKYEKTERFFKSHHLHGFLKKQGGDIMKAITNATRSVIEARQSKRDYTYSEMADMFKSVGIVPPLSKNKKLS